TLGLLVIVNVVLVGAKDVTRGSQTFFGLTESVTLWTALVWAVVAIVVARLFREAIAGLQLRASREDQLAARSTGVDRRRRGLGSWVLGAMLMAVAGALLGHFLAAFSPKAFYFDLTFSLLAMLILGGMTTVSGAVGGAAIVTLLTELLRRVEEGPGGLPQIFG